MRIWTVQHCLRKSGYLLIVTSVDTKLLPGFGNETCATMTEGDGKAVIPLRSGSSQRIGGSLEKKEGEAGSGGSESASRYIVTSAVSEINPDEIRASLRHHSERVIQTQRERVSLSLTKCKPISELRSVTCHLRSPITQHRRTRLAVTLARQVGTRFTYPVRMESWVDFGVGLYRDGLSIRRQSPIQMLSDSTGSWTNDLLIANPAS